MIQSDEKAELVAAVKAGVAAEIAMAISTAVIKRMNPGNQEIGNFREALRAIRQVQEEALSVIEDL